ncbi:ArsR/SmtB family transcription factor [Pseudomonas sp. 6D_7.1_Bac1]|uniref:ArsR/SmtB family transcription factor n=1 Tax=Pseudomonas sp. 6D_7.1_Bac1 TaxID=2971615 RepID=UPI0021C67DA9|nr:helix-turn-helix domain-containing protein [Pseudomonas sp. 6D_7.1_Bac1]MCU1748035.1 helix-turn-helix domain-containing protein [Pseudomonas sp. 6D_7.1_Bac1]
MMDYLVVLKALASEPRLRVLEWLKEPVTHFPPQVDGDFEADGVCADYIREKLGVAAATASRHLTLLTDAQLLIATRKKGWVFYRRNEVAITQLSQDLKEL